MTKENIVKLKKLAKSGNAEAAYDLAYAFVNGEGVKRNSRKATKLQNTATTMPRSALKYISVKHKRI